MPDGIPRRRSRLCQLEFAAFSALPDAWLPGRLDFGEKASVEELLRRLACGGRPELGVDGGLDQFGGVHGALLAPRHLQRRIHQTALLRGCRGLQNLLRQLRLLRDLPQHRRRYGIRNAFCHLFLRYLGVHLGGGDCGWLLIIHAIGREPGKVAWTKRLAMLAPDIIHRILSGDIPQNLTLEKLRAPLPDLWEEQRAMLLENQ